MCNSSTITKIYKGSWMEILSHREEIPDISEVQLIVYSERKEDDEEEQARLHQNLNQLFEEADRKEFTPTKEEIRDVNLELDK